MINMQSILNKKNKYSLDLKLDKYGLLIIFIGFFLGRVSVFDRMTPFGIAFLGSFIMMKGSNLGLLLSVILGTLSFQGLSGLSYYIISFIIYSFFSWSRKQRNYTLVGSSIIAAIIFIIVKSLETMLFNTFFIYDLFLICFEGILIFTMTYVFSYSIPIEGVGKNRITNEKLVCSFITLALVLSGFNNLFIFGVSLKNIISPLIVIYFSYSQGVLMGVSSGIVLGMVSYISHTEMPFIISILGVGGLLSGLFKDLGRSGALLGFILGNAIISFYINGIGVSFLSYKEIFISSVIFLLSANILDRYIAKLFMLEDKLKKEYEDKRVEIITKKLTRMVDLFNNLSLTFKKTTKDDTLYSSLEVYNLIDEVSNKTCKNCYNCNKCWGSNYYSTYYDFFNYIGLIESESADKERILKKIKSACSNHITLFNNIEKSYEEYKINQRWNLKLKEQRLLISEQLEGLGTIIENITKDIYKNPVFNDELEELLFKELKNNRIDIEEVTVAQLDGENFEILVDLNSDIDSSDKVEKVKTIISDNLGCSLGGDYTFGNLANERRRFKLIRNNRYSSLTKISKAANTENNISGDNYTFGEIENNAFIAISDGMGIGRKANAESSTAIELLERLMEAGADKEMIIKTINSVLRARSNNEVFTTLDLGFIDLYKGRLQMVKTGTPPTFIKKKDRVIVINSASLPIGILKDVDFKIYEENIEDGDIIIMMSDGVLDSNRNIENSEEWMKDVIRGIDSQNPQTIADEILSIAKFVCGNQHDDMTVLVTKVWKNV